MQGKARIIVKDINGNIKQDIEEKNTVFNIPKLLFKPVLENTDLGSGNGEMFNSILNYYNWFRSIKINDEFCSEEDCRDYKLPVLWGSEAPNLNTSQTRYAPLVTASSSINNNILKRVFTWTGCPEFKMRSVNLTHLYNGGNDYSGQTTTNNLWPGCTTNAQLQIYKLGNFYFSPTLSSSNNSNMIINSNTLYRKGNFKWQSTKTGKKFTKVVQVTQPSYYSSGSWSSYNVYTNCCIRGCINNEIMLAHYNQDVFTDSSETRIRYISFIDNISGDLKRTIPLTALEGFVSSLIPYYYEFKLITNQFGNYIITRTNNTSPGYGMSMYKLPDTYNDGDIIPKLYDITTIYNSNSLYNVFVIEDCVFFGNQRKTLKFKSDSLNADEALDLYNYIPFNYTSSSTDTQYAQSLCGVNFGKLQGEAVYYIDSSFACWYNTTALNLAEEIDIAEGDTLTIEYTITAN